ncbi:MAG: 1-acyl-sn-glycerol-3-phosphate acyltransferase [Clostridia bacterium]|nr:1-acyl-sn-glycerol-3-phosphate acyltransferase [Clostridia bacterium]
MNKLYKILICVLKPLIKIVYRLKITGMENIPKSGRAILCPNHTSNADPVILAISCPRQVFFMAKKELFSNKFLRKILLYLGAFPVDRGNRDKGAINIAEEVLQKGNILGLFIEGTRSKTGEFLKPKNGAALLACNTHTPVVPICISGGNQKRVRAFRKNVINIGSPIYYGEKNNAEMDGKEIRNFSRQIMDAIMGLSGTIKKQS